VQVPIADWAGGWTCSATAGYVDSDSCSFLLARNGFPEFRELHKVRHTPLQLFNASLRRAKGAARWFVRGCRAWLSFRPGSRPHRVARRLRMMLSPSGPKQLSELPPSARRVYAELKTGIAKRRGRR